MPFNRPSLADIERDLQADVQSRLPGTDPRLRRSYLGAIARGISGALHELWGYLAWIARQIFATSADEENVVLQAAEWGIERIAAVAASGSLTVTGTVGADVPAGTVWKSPDGREYASDAAAVIGAGGSVDIDVEAVVAGAAGNAASGTAVSLVSPLAGIVSAATAATALAGGADIETVDALRARLLFRKRNPPKGGATPDYRRWADAASSLDHRVWVAPLGVMQTGDTPVLGTVTVYYAPDSVALDASGNWVDADISGLIDAVDAYIEARRPATADVTVRAPDTQRVDFTIDTISPDTAAVRAAIEAELADLIQRETEPGGTLLISRIREAISTAEGESDHSLTSPAANVVAPQHTILVMGDVSWP